MKPKYLVIVSLTLILIAGCATVPRCPPCPPENTIFMTPSGPAEMPKGFFDTGEGQNWMHTDDYKNHQRNQKGL